jgi:hypothetical protein
MNRVTPFENYSNTIFDKNFEQRNNKTIFVSIPCYRDKNVINTIKSMILNAKRPENIYISVAFSLILNHEKWISEINQLASSSNINLKVKVHEVFEVNKIGELRSIADAEYNKEDYYMQISPSTEFDPMWDDILIKQYEDIINNRPNEKVIFTCEPRGYLPHDDVVEGYTFFTNHKTKISMQRQESDYCRVPIVGFNEFVLQEHIDSNYTDQDDSQGLSQILQDEIVESLKAEKFLEKNGFPIFTSRSFRKDEYIASALGVSSKFIFAKAKDYLKNNPADRDCIDFEEANFISFVNLLNSGYSIFSLRFTPLYHLYEGKDLFSPIRKSPKDFYEDTDMSDTSSYKKCKKIIEDFNLLDMDKKARMGYLFSIDWDANKFKVRSKQLDDVLVKCINSSVSLYNFSINENTLHWNKTGL